MKLRVRSTLCNDSQRCSPSIMVMLLMARLTYSSTCKRPWVGGGTCSEEGRQRKGRVRTSQKVLQQDQP